MSEGERAETQLFFDVMAAPDSLRPDVLVSRSERMHLAARALDVHVTDNTAIEAHGWLYDARRRVAWWVIW